MRNAHGTRHLPPNIHRVRQALWRRAPEGQRGALLAELTAHVKAEAPELLAKLDATGVLLDAAADELRALLAAFLTK